MKSFFVHNETLENKLSFWHLLLFVISLPFDRFYSQIFLISFTMHTLIHLKKERIQKLLCKEVLFLSMPFLITVLSTFYSPHAKVAFGFWEKQLAILLFPILFRLNPIDLRP